MLMQVLGLGPEIEGLLACKESGDARIYIQFTEMGNQEALDLLDRL